MLNKGVLALLRLKTRPLMRLFYEKRRRAVETKEALACTHLSKGLWFWVPPVELAAGFVDRPVGDH